MKDKVNWVLFAATVLGLFGTSWGSVMADSARREAAHVQGELNVCNAKEELSSSTTDACFGLVNTCNENLNVCIQGNNMVLRTCGWELY